MITEFLINLFYGIISTMVSLLPVVDVPVELSNGLGKVVSFFDTFSYYVPVDSFLVCAGIIFVVSNIQLILFLTNWVIRRVADILP